jgi:hypothetical protein
MLTQHGLIEFSFIAGKCFKKILKCGVDNFYSRRFFKKLVEQVNQPAKNKGGRYITNEDHDQDHH